jgi:DNA-binding NarL/FixJ family response regulator
MGRHHDAPSSASPAVVKDKIRLLIVDAPPILRWDLTALLGVQDDIEIVGTAEAGWEAMKLLQKVPVGIILLDLRMPAFLAFKFDALNFRSSHRDKLH